MRSFILLLVWSSSRFVSFWRFLCISLPLYTTPSLHAAIQAPTADVYLNLSLPSTTTTSGSASSFFFISLTSTGQFSSPDPRKILSTPPPDNKNPNTNQTPRLSESSLLPLANPPPPVTPNREYEDSPAHINKNNSKRGEFSAQSLLNTDYSSNRLSNPLKM